MHFKDENGGLHFLSGEDISNGGMVLLPSGCVEITDEEADAIRAAQLATSLRYVPPQVTRFQARAALHQAGLLAQVEVAIAEPDTDMMLKLAWQDAQTFKRDSQFISGMAKKLGLPDQKLDDLFISASQIE